MAYKNGIQLNVNLTPLNDLKKELDSTIKALEKDNNLKLNINVNEISTSFKEIANIIGSLSTQLNKSFKIDTSSIDNVGNKLKNIQNLSSTSNTFKINSDGTTELVKSVDKINVGLGETITLTKDLEGKLTATSNIDYSKKQKEVDEQYKLQLKDLQELNNLELKRQQELEKSQQKVKSIQETLNSKLSNSSKNNLIDESVLKNLQKELNAINVDTPISKIKELKTQINNLGSSDNQIVKLQNEINKMTSGLSSLKGKYGGLVGNSNSKKELEDYISEINKLKSTLNDLKSGKSLTGNQLSQQFTTARSASKELTNAVKDNASALKLAQKDASSFGDTIKHAFQSAGIFTSVYDGIRLISNGFKEGLQSVIDMDTALGNLNKVVNLSSQQLIQMRDSAVEMGKELGRSAVEVANAQAEFGRLYKDQNQINEMTRVSLMGANVMDGVSADEVAKSLTTIVTSMKKNATDSMSILDSMNEIQNNYRVGADDLMKALAEVGSTAYTSGANLEKVEGYITAISVATGQSGDEVGNALRSIMSRIYKIGAEGIEAEGKPEKMLKDVGVAVRDSSGQFREFSTILDDLDGKWGSLSNTEQIAVAQQVAGVQRYNQFISLMNNYQMAVDATTTALNSQGSATKENAIHMQTAEAKLGVLKATLQETAFKLINSDGVKGAIDGITSLVSAFGNLPSIIGLATMSLLLFKGKAILGAIEGIYTLVAGETVMTTATVGASLAWEKLNIVMSSNPLGVIALLFTGVALAINKANKAEQDLIDNNKKVIDSFESEKSAMDGANKLYQQKLDLENQISQTNEGTEENKKLKEQLLEVEKQLATALPNSVSGYNQQGQAISANNKLIEAQLELKRKQLDLESLEQLKDNKTLFDNDIKSFKNLQQTLDDYKKSRDELLEKKSNADSSGNKIISFTSQNALDDYNEDISKMEEMIAQRRLLILQQIDLGKSYQQISNETGIAVEDLHKYTDVINETDMASKSATNGVDGLSNGIDDISDSANDAQTSLENLSKAFNDLSNTNSDIDSVIADMQEFGGITEQTYSKIIDNPAILQALTSEGDTIQNLTKLQEENRQSMEDRIQQAVDTANGVNSSQQSEADSKVDTDNQKQQSDSNTNNQIRKNTSDTTTQNSENYSKDGGNFDSTSQAKNTSDSGFQSAWRGNTADSVNEMGGMYQTDYSNFKSATDAKNALLENFRSNLASMGSVFSNAEDALNPLVNTLTQPWNVANGSSEGIAGALDNAFGTDSLKAMQEYKDGLSQIAGTFDSITGKKITTGNVQAPEIKKVSSSAPSMVKGNSGESGSKGGSGGSGSSGESDAEKWTDKIKELNSSIDIDRYADLNSQLDILDNHFTDNKNSLDGLTEGTKAYHDKQKEQIDIMKEQASTYSLLAGSYATERDELKQNLSQYGILTDATGKLTNAEAKLKYQQDLANDMSGNTEEEYKAKKKQIDAIKELEENIKRYREVTESEIPKCTQKWDELNNTIIKTQREQLQAMMDDLASALETKYSKAKEEELQKVEDWYSQRKENLESEYQQDLASLQDEKQSIVDEYDEQIKKLQAQLDKLNDESDNKQAKLSALKAELALWGKDTSVFSKRKQEELNQSIKDLELEIQKDNLQKEIDALKDKQSAQEDSLSTEIDNLESAHDDELDELEKSYNAKKKETEDHYDKLLDEQSRYNEASKLMMSNSQEEILELLQSKSEDWKNVGILLGENFADGLRSQVEQVMSDLSSLTGGTLGKNNSTSNNNSYTSKENNMATSSGNNNSKSNSINGKSYTVDDSGNISSKDALSNEEIAEIQKKIARFATGGRTPSNMSGGKLGILDPNEKILNSEDTNTFDKGMEIINTDLKDFIDKFDSTYKLNTLNGYSNLDVFGNTTDLNSMANRAMNNTTNNSSDNSTIVQMDVNIVNNNLQDVGMNEKNIEKVIRKVVKTDGRRFK